MALMLYNDCMRRFISIFTALAIVASLCAQSSYAQLTVAHSDTVSAYIGTAGNYHLTLYGYTSPHAMVRLDGLAYYDITYARQDGYFEFKRTFSRYQSKEACLQSQDQFGRLSAPVCTPPFPLDSDVNIGPIIMPPTLSLNSTAYIVGDQIVLSGQTLPDSPVNLSMFTKDGASLFPSDIIAPAVEAFSIPKLSMRSDAKGNFAITLPSSAVQIYRIFTQVQYTNALSPKSNTLQLSVLPFWIIFFQWIFYLIGLLKPYLLQIGIFVQLAILTYWILHRSSRKISTLAIRSDHALVKYGEYPNTFINKN